jgi:probable phosphoglycerate mutase
MEPTRLVAVRHGETAWNAAARIQGQTDIGLNDLGRWQAQRVAQALAHEPVAAVYSSDLLRAWHTAEPIAQAHGLAPVAEAGLRERAFGVFEGKSFDDVQEQYPEDGRLWRERLPAWAPPGGGESLDQMRERVGATVARLAARHAGAQIVLAAHGGVLDTLYRLATGQAVNAPRTWQLPNCAINRLLWTPDSLTLVGWSDTAHLEGEALDETVVT